MSARDWQNEGYIARYLRPFDSAMHEKRDRHTLEWLQTLPDDEVLNIGAGHGNLAFLIAPLVKRVIAVDPTVQAIRRARLGARQQGLTNISFQVAGFHDFDVKPEALSRVVTRDGLHHLTDVQKRSALERINRALKPGGVVLIQDVIFPFPLASVEERLPEIINTTTACLGHDVAVELGRTIARQHPAGFDDLVSLLAKTGFEVDSSETAIGCYTTLRCVKSAA